MKLSIEITTLSNLFIGGSPVTFEIGGIDLYTVTSNQGVPYIPASSLKGGSKQIGRETNSQMPDDLKDASHIIGQAYKEYLTVLQEHNQKEVKQYNIEQERIDKMNARYKKVIDQASVESLFGIEGFNDSPKLMFNDLLPITQEKDIEKYFSIDSKNSIQQNDEGDVPQVSANPRTYRVVRPGITFAGDIILYNMEKLQHDGHDISKMVESYLTYILDQFNTGFYRLGNSGSRGYGRIKLDIVEGETRHG